MKKIKELIVAAFNRLKNNWKMKLLSLFLALILWNSVIVGTDPDITRTTDPLPVTITGAEQLNAKGWAIASSTEEYLESVTVTVLMKRSQSRTFDESDIKVTLDLVQITETGEQILKLNATTSVGDVESITPSSFRVTVDEKKNKIVQIEAELEGQLSEGFFLGEITVDPNFVQVSGPKSVVDQIEAAKVTIDLTDRETSIEMPKEFELVDADGQVVESNTIETSISSAMFEMSIMPRKEIQIIGENYLSGMDKLPDGYEVEEIEVYPETIEVTGSQELLELFTSPKGEIQDVAGKSEDFSTEIHLLLPNGITFLSPDTISIIVRIGEIMEKVTFTEQEVELRNIPSNMRADSFSQIRDVEMKVPYNTAETLTESHVHLYIDMADLEAGTHELKIQCEVPGEFRVEDIVVTNNIATVELVER